MKQMPQIFKKLFPVLVWTVFYIAFMWAVLLFMFNFDIFSSENWWRLAHAELRGFGGFVFGILILAALPIYIATTAITARRGALLFTIKVPAFITKLFTAPPPVTEPAPDAAPTPTDIAPMAPEKKLPSELRAVFLRARENMTNPVLTSAPGEVEIPSNAIAPADSTEQNMALPTDFDFDDVPDFDDDIGDFDAPTFTDMNFDDADAPHTATETNNDLYEYLVAHNHAIIAQRDNIIITDQMAIASHTDDEFWIADDNDWFAAGRQKPSPVHAILKAATEHNVQPVLYLGATNIMDLEKMRTTWAEMDILVIDALSDLGE